MATLEQLEAGVRKAYDIGNMEYARILGAQLVEARKDKANLIPGASVPSTTEQKPEPGIIDKAIGTAEAGLTALTGATSGMFGGVVGGAQGVLNTVRDGTFGTQEGVRSAGNAALEGMQTLTKMPTTESGKQQTAVMGEAMSSLPPFVGIGGGLAGALSVAAKPAIVQGVQAVKQGGTRAAATVAQNIPQGLQDAAKAGLNRLNVGTPSQAAANPAQTAGVSMGAAGAQPVNIARASVANSSPELQTALEQVIKKGEPINQKALDAHIEADGLPVKMRHTQGQAIEDPILISEERNARARNPEYIAFFDEQNKQLIDNMNAVKEKTAPDVFLQSIPEHGEGLIQIYKNLDKKARSEISANYKVLEEANGGSFPLDTQTFVRTAEENIAKKNRARFLPAEVRGMLDDYKNGEPMTFNGFEELRTILASEARKADRAGDGNRAMAVSAVRNALEDLPMTGATEQIKQLADIARNSAKARFDMIAADPAYKAVAKGTASADGFINKYVIGADLNKLQTMFRHLEKDEGARQIAASAVLNHLKQVAKIQNDTGTFAQNSFNTQLSKLSPKLNDIFGQESADILQKIGNVARRNKFQPEGSYVNNPNTAIELMKNGAASTAETIVNAATGAVTFGTAKGGTALRKTLEGRAESKRVKKSLSRGAGISERESKLLEVKRKVKEAEERKRQKARNAASQP